MSRSKPQSGGSNSPIKYRLSFSGKTGEVKYYDKDTKEDVFMSDLEFVVLDKRSSITGFSDSENTSIYSNLIRNLKTDELVVKAGAKVFAKGLYEDIKPKLADFSGKFTTNVLLLAKIDGKWEMGNLQFVGSGLSAWMNFEQGKDDNGESLSSGKPDVNGSIITITKGAAKKKGAVKYVIPMFTTTKITPELDTLAMEQDIILQDYFDGASESNTPTAKEAPAESRKDKPKAAPQPEEEHDDLPF